MCEYLARHCVFVMVMMLTLVMVLVVILILVLMPKLRNKTLEKTYGCLLERSWIVISCFRHTHIGEVLSCS